MKRLELLAPAKNLVCGLAAIDHGADAVYIGADRFGARSAAGNPVDDIRRLCDHAHTFMARVYVTVNTLIHDDELADTERLIWDLYHAGVDAVIVQDMGILQMNLPPVELHASTQTDIRTVGKAQRLAEAGFTRLVPARELSADDLRTLHEALPDIELEAFVHGALCVSYSGLCYVSQHCFGRSANRGECAQFCRFRFDLVDAAGTTIIRDKHLLSLKDMNRLDDLGKLIEAGVMSFKIEGRLKDEVYVKNVVSAYSRKLDQWIAAHTADYRRASLGRCSYTFEPDVAKTFNRGFTPYMLHRRMADITAFDTPKFTGPCVGKVKEVKGKSFTVSGMATFENGDGLCYFDNGKLEGFRVNKAESNRLFPYPMPARLKPGTRLYRNQDMAFDRQTAGQTARRKMAVEASIAYHDERLVLNLTVKDTRLGVKAESSERPEPAQKSQTDNIRTQICKLGDTPFECASVVIDPSLQGLFVRAGRLADLRRRAAEQLVTLLREQPRGQAASRRPVVPAAGNNDNRRVADEYGPHRLFYNITNRLARRYYAERGVTDDGMPPLNTEPVMQCRHCLRHALGHCVVHGGTKPDWTEPLYLQTGNGKRFRLSFDCRQCQMNVYAEE